MMQADVKQGHVLDVLADMPAESCHCVVTSPPYFGLRDYGKCTKVGWDPYFNDGRPHEPWFGQLGLEPTIDSYVAHVVEVFRAVRRVLRKDGTLWLNVGDSYTGGGRGKGGGDLQKSNIGSLIDAAPPIAGLKDKNLLGQPWRIAFALQADGWILRSAIIWAKPNPMPESVTDRPAKSYELVFLFAKSQQYFWDAEAVRERARYGYSPRTGDFASGIGGKHGPNTITPGDGAAGRNLRDVWTIPTEAVKDAHFAAFPRRLAAQCIKAGTSERGCCPECGAPWVRVVERTPMVIERSGRSEAMDKFGRTQASGTMASPAITKTLGWKPGCECGRPAGVIPFKATPCTVLDPFCGSGQCGIAATQLGRAFIGIEINPEYAAMARRRIANPEPLPEVADMPGQMEMFA